MSLADNVALIDNEIQALELEIKNCTPEEYRRLAEMRAAWVELLRRRRRLVEQIEAPDPDTEAARRRGYMNE